MQQQVRQMHLRRGCVVCADERGGTRGRHEESTVQGCRLHAPPSSDWVGAFTVLKNKITLTASLHGWIFMTKPSWRVKTQPWSLSPLCTIFFRLGLVVPWWSSKTTYRKFLHHWLFLTRWIVPVEISCITFLGLGGNLWFLFVFFLRHNLVLLNGVKAHFKILCFSKSFLSPGRESFIHDTTWCLCSSGFWSPPGGGRRVGDTGSSYMFFFLQADTLKMPHECTSRILNRDASSGNAHLDLFAENSLMKSWSRKFSFVENIWGWDNFCVLSCTLCTIHYVHTLSGSSTNWPRA